MWLEVWNFQSYFLTSGRGEGLEVKLIINGQWLNQPYLSNVCVQSHFSRVWLFATLWTVAALSMGFSKQEYWSELPCPPPGDLPDPKCISCTGQAGSLRLVSPGKPLWEMKVWALESFWVGEPVELLGARCAWRGVEALCPFPEPCPKHLFPLTIWVTSFHDKLIT